MDELQEGQQALMASVNADEAAVRILEDAGYRSIFDIARHSAKIFRGRTTALEPALADALHAQARKRVTTLMSLCRAYQSRNEPVMQRIPKLGIKPLPKQLAEAVQRSLGGAPDFSDLFPERSEDGYAEATSIQSLFSPGRYLTELYKIARGLHSPHSPLNIDQRRPDIALLTLNEQNMSKELPTLDILTDVLLEGIQRYAKTSISALETTYYPMTLPYHDSLVQIRSVLSGANTSLQQVWAILSDRQAQAFSPLIYRTPVDPEAGIATPWPDVRETLQLAPATYALLAGDPATAADIKRDYALPSDDIASELRLVEVFIERTGLTFNQLVELTGQADPEATVYAAKSRYYRFGHPDEAVPVTEYGQTYVATAQAGLDPLLIAPGEIDYKLIGTTYALTFPDNGGERTSTITIADIFRSAADGSIACMIDMPADTYTLIGNHDAKGQHLGTVEAVPLSYTGSVAPQVNFAAGAYVPNGQNGAPGAATALIRVVPYGPELQLRLTADNAVTLADRAERLIRLQRQVDIEFHQLDWLIKNANLAFSPRRANRLLVDQPVLAAVAEFVRLRQSYGLSCDAFACFIGAMNIYAPASQMSMYEKLFTSDTYRITVPLHAVINFDASHPNDYQSIVAGALGVSTNELFVMAQLAFVDPTAVAMDESRYAQLYRLAMIPQMLGISFNQARLLWQMLDPSRNLAATVAGPATLEVLEIIRQMEAALLWMSTHQLTVDQCFHLTTDVYSESTTPDLYNFVQNIYTSLSSDDGAIQYRSGQPLSSSLKQKLFSLTASPFKIKPNVMGRLIQWIDVHFTTAQRANGPRVPYGLGDYWADIEALFSQPDVDLKDLAGMPDIARYSQALAQYALIAQWANLSEQDLTLIVDTPQWFIGGTPVGVPANSLNVLLYISRLKQWQQRVVVPEAEAMAYFKYANAPDQTENDATGMLAYLHGWDLDTTRAMSRFLSDNGAYALFPTTFAQVLRLESWMRIGAKVRIGSSTVNALYQMSLQDAAAEAASMIKQVAEQLAATLQPPASSQSAVTQMKQTRRDALVDYYIAYCIPETPIDEGAPLPTRIRNANDLYEYLLIDTKIGDAVTTSRVGEAISAVQLYINRCLGGYDPDVDNQSDSTMVLESRPGGFLYDWADYNQVYSTWAGKERLQYYPSVYVNPSLRYNKTVLFDALEETINQGRISDQRIEDAFQQYLQGFETVAELTTISGYQAGLVARVDSADTVYFVGRTPSPTPEYYWRACNMAVRNDLGEISGGAWSEWLKIGAPAQEALDGMVRPCWFQNRLHVGWIGRTEVGVTGSGNDTVPTYQHYAEVWRLQGSDQWVCYRREELPQKPLQFALIGNVGLDMLDIHCLYTEYTWANYNFDVVHQDCMPVLIGEPVTGAILTGHAGSPDYSMPDSHYIYRWYRADDPAGVKKTLISGQTAKTYRLQTTDRNKYIVFEVIPKSAPLMGHKGSVTTEQIGDAQGTAPSVSNLSITGTLVVGGKLTVNYSYYDADGDLEDTSADGTQFQWYRYRANAYLTPISGATGRSYTLTGDDQGDHSILVRVTPRSLTGSPNTGSYVQAETPKFYGSPPIVTNVSLSGQLRVGSVLTVSYTYSDADGDPDDTLIEWFRHRPGHYITQIPGASGRTYTIKGTDQGDHAILARVTPKSKSGVPKTGVPIEVQTAIGVFGTAPTIGNLSLSGQIRRGSTATINYDYFDADGDPEGDSLYVWTGYFAQSAMVLAVGPRSYTFDQHWDGVYIDVYPKSRTGMPNEGRRYGIEVIASGRFDEPSDDSAVTKVNGLYLSGDLFVGSTLTIERQGSDVAGGEDAVGFGGATFEWLFRKSDGETSPITGAVGRSYTLTGADQGDHSILVRVARRSSSAEFDVVSVESARGVFGTAPTASNLLVTGNPQEVGAVLTVQYHYEDVDGDAEDTSIEGTAFQWFVQTPDGGAVAIPGATERSYTVTEDAVAYGVRARVTPKSRTGYPNVGAWREVATRETASPTLTGIWVDGQLLPGTQAAGTAPVARNPAIVGKCMVGATLLANYEYFDAEGDAEDASAAGTQFQWGTHKKNTWFWPIPGATQRTYTVVQHVIGDGHDLAVWITPKSKTGTPAVGPTAWGDTGLPVVGTWRFTLHDQWFGIQQSNNVTAIPKKIAYLRTDSAVPFSSRLLQQGPAGLLTYDSQTMLIEHDGTQPIDFNGSYSPYFWEIFFHSSFLIADRYLTEQNYPQSQLWYRYIFSPAGYRNAEGELETINGVERYWNVVPLQQDATWNVAIPPTVDPDAICMNDPMHYKVAIFLNYVNAYIEQGDTAYRMLQRDYLVQAKMYYLQAAQMLGPRPSIDYRTSWANPSVAQEANAIAVVDFDSPDAPARTPLTQLLAAYLYEKNGDFLPPYNADLLAYWDKLEVRFHNLRNNLSLDGQPLAMPLYAQPMDPRELQRRFGAGNGPGGNSVNANTVISQYRFPVLLERAQSAVKAVMRLGRTLLKALESRDNEDVNFLLRTQRQHALRLTDDIESTQIAILQDELTASESALAGARQRLTHYEDLYQNWITGSEQRAMDMRTAAGTISLLSQPFSLAEAGTKMAPNIFGFAVGGSEYGALLGAMKGNMELWAGALSIGAERLDISEQYRRRRQEWQIERDNATHEVAELEATIQAKTLQVSMARKQLALTRQELADEIAVHNLFDAAFTGPALYNWMCGRLAAIYYQHYDATLSLCLGCKAALAREIGPGRAHHLFNAPMWNDLYQGLLAGEGLLLELQKMENTYLKDDRRGLEIVRPVPLDRQIQEADASLSLAAMVQAALSSTSVPVTGGVEVSMLENSKLVIKLSLDTLGLDAIGGSTGKTGRLKNISVTLAPMVSADQNLDVTLGLGGTYVVLSRGQDDSGVFMLDRDDARYLPFEGESTTGTLVLTFFDVGPGGGQRMLVEGLTDVIYQIWYTLKEF